MAISLSSGAAAFECPIGREDGRFIPLTWSAEPADDGWTAIHMVGKNPFDKTLKFVWGETVFVALPGSNMDDFSIQLLQDRKIPAGGTITTTTSIDNPKYRALVSAKPETFELHFCTRRVLFEDGSDASF
jgi:hypothetical protein